MALEEGASDVIFRDIGCNFTSTNQIFWLFSKCPFRILNKAKHVSLKNIMLFSGLEHVALESGSSVIFRGTGCNFTSTNQIFGYFQKVPSKF